MADFNQAIGKILLKEGGSRYTNDPNDRGGPTRYGISQRSYPNLDIEHLTEAEAKDIYKRDYWDKLNLDVEKSQAIAEYVFDCAVNCGVGTAIAMEKATHTEGMSDQERLSLLILARVSRYVDIVNRNKTQSKYLLGWLNRALGVV